MIQKDPTHINSDEHDKECEKCLDKATRRYNKTALCEKCYRARKKIDWESNNDLFNSLMED